MLKTVCDNAEQLNSSIMILYQFIGQYSFHILEGLVFSKNLSNTCLNLSQFGKIKEKKLKDNI